MLQTPRRVDSVFVVEDESVDFVESVIGESIEKGHVRRLEVMRLSHTQMEKHGGAEGVDQFSEEGDLRQES